MSIRDVLQKDASFSRTIEIRLSSGSDRTVFEPLTGRRRDSFGTRNNQFAKNPKYSQEAVALATSLQEYR
ncbi:MAG TPA: hypothetical protein VEL49_01545 [Ktedonobacteraceae bacterium]|nr:hypothetical protein [Ktedonobacteraceae bacterium]